jgi:predicted metal-binding membrane protein
MADPSAAADRLEPWVYGGLLAALVAAAWVALGLVGASSVAPRLSHATLGEPGGLTPAGIAIFVAGWTLMSVAMMLPTAFPLVRVFLTITSRSAVLLAWLCAAYLGVWALFGVAAVCVDAVLHRVLGDPAGLATASARLPGALLLGAGLFQFSPLKYACMRECRSPVGFVVQHWRGGSRVGRALRLGALHGLYCVGCCWALMLLMFAVGGVHLGWMLGLAGVMFVEKTLPWGRRVTWATGVALSVWGVALLAAVPGVPRPF